MMFKVFFLIAVSMFVVLAFPQDAVPAAEEPVIAPALEIKKDGNACEVDGKAGVCMDFETCPKNPDGIKRLPNDACDSFLDVCCIPSEAALAEGAADAPAPVEAPAEVAADAPADAPAADAPASEA